MMEGTVQQKHPIELLDAGRLDWFRDLVWKEGTANYRDLPWRRTHDPYTILLSEVMLQQTQVSRVQLRWETWLDEFPTLDALAAAPLSRVLEAWQGLGYNRRAVALKRTAETCATMYDGRLPAEYPLLIALPGIGPATAAGVRAFAFDKTGVYLETNVRTVILYELLPGCEMVSDKTIASLVGQTCDPDNPRGWYYAMLDYGALLKRTVPNPSRRSAHHAAQSPFEGSRRQKRAWLVRAILAVGEGTISTFDLCRQLGLNERAAGREAPDPGEVESILSDLLADGLVAQVGKDPYEESLAVVGSGLWSAPTS